MVIRAELTIRLIVSIWTVSAVSGLDTVVNGVDFFGYEADEAENEDPCFYDSRRDVSAKRLDKCLEQVKRSASDTGLYWFGERWKTTCSSPRTNAANAVSNVFISMQNMQSFLFQIACYNPPKLQRYESLGARLLRVPTFDMAYLRHLAIFPQMIFVSTPGK